MQVTEIFRSIQGESTYAGLPCIFVRLTGCNLRCVWCDTAYAFHGGKRMSVEEVMAAVRGLSDREGNRLVSLVELTGGEPLVQKETYPLIDKLLADRYRVLIETSGERFVGNLPRQVVKILDVKCPGSGESDKFCFDNLSVLEPKDEIKFVIDDENDYRYALDFMAKHELRRCVDEVIFSPVFGRLHPRQLAEWILRDSLEVRMGMQIHKFIWEPEARSR